MNKYAISYLVNRPIGWMGEIHNCLFIVDANSEEEAIGMGYKRVEKDYPKKNGWTQNVIVLKV